MEGCETRGELYYHPLYLFAVVFQGISGYMTFPMLFFIFKKYAFKVYYHPNLVVSGGLWMGKLKRSIKKSFIE